MDERPTSTPPGLALVEDLRRDELENDREPDVLGGRLRLRRRYYENTTWHIDAVGANDLLGRRFGHKAAALSEGLAQLRIGQVAGRQ